ncbi:hypothetical protein PILCRDRAFT_102672 [Piloderma croceum F 1598]|uniref:Uncharacterized protein n=1 Tax=Piloderma croceum (strain F 1598) TaxID=765440 RepID=A0A0C3GJR2_PILCF|nr:hypothetical protein PILCRDRAFT_102672 [Piloderma croceum F 1598]
MRDVRVPFTESLSLQQHCSERAKTKDVCEERGGQHRLERHRLWLVVAKAVKQAGNDGEQRIGTGCESHRRNRGRNQPCRQRHPGEVRDYLPEKASEFASHGFPAGKAVGLTLQRSSPISQSSHLLAQRQTPILQSFLSCRLFSSICL